MSHPVLRPGTVGKLEKLRGDVCACVHSGIKEMQDLTLQEVCSKTVANSRPVQPQEGPAKPQSIL